MAPKKHWIGTLAALIVGLLFAQCLLLTVLFGARSYRTVTASADHTYTRRVALSYLTQRVRAYEGQGTISAGEFQDLDALYCYETADGMDYQTILYVYDGWLRELYTAAGDEFAPEEGIQLIEMQTMSLSHDGELLHVTLTDNNGQSAAGILHLRGGAL